MKLVVQTIMSMENSIILSIGSISIGVISSDPLIDVSSLLIYKYLYKSIVLFNIEYYNFIRIIFIIIHGYPQNHKGWYILRKIGNRGFPLPLLNSWYL